VVSCKCISQSFRNVIIFNLLGLIFSTGIIPETLNYTHIIPLIKDSKKPSDSLNNLRPISISNTVAHIFERILQLKMPNLIKTHKNKFGYMDKCSCSHALFAFEETILSYIENKKHCYVVTLDAVKAFDSVWRELLFVKLKKRNFDRNLIIIIQCYDKLYAKIKLGNLFLFLTHLKIMGV
jgi:hypothetical protein